MINQIQKEQLLNIIDSLILNAGIAFDAMLFGEARKMLESANQLLTILEVTTANYENN